MRQGLDLAAADEVVDDVFILRLTERRILGGIALRLRDKGEHLLGATGEFDIFEGCGTRQPDGVRDRRHHRHRQNDESRAS